MTPRIEHVIVLRLNLRNGEPLPSTLETLAAEFAWCDGWFDSLPDALRADFRHSRLYGSGASLASFLAEARRGQLAAHSIVEPANTYSVVDVYQAIRQSPKWEESLLVVTWGDGKGPMPAILISPFVPRAAIVLRCKGQSYEHVLTLPNARHDDDTPWRLDRRKRAPGAVVREQAGWPAVTEARALWSPTGWRASA
jgi:hypothetical protein